MGYVRKGFVVPGEVLSAREQASRIVAAAAATVEEARRRGFAEGYAAGREAALAEATELLARARAEAEQRAAESRDLAVALARRMAERIVGRALELHPVLIAEIAAQALAATRARSGPVTLRAHPDDLAVIERERPRLHARLAASVDLRLVADAGIERGGCVVETPLGRLDARLPAQLDALERALGAGAGAP